MSVIVLSRSIWFYDEEQLSLDEIGSKFSLHVFDLDESLYGLDSRDPKYGIEVIKTQVPKRVEPTSSIPLGLNLVELASGHGSDSRGLVLVENVEEDGLVNTFGQGKIQRGDTIVSVSTIDTNIPTENKKTMRVEAQNLEETLDVIQRARQSSHGDMLEINAIRLVRRKVVHVIVDAGDSDNAVGSMNSFDVLSGTNLRMELLTKSLKIYDANTNRYDQPYAKGDCGGEGICGTCTVHVLQGQDLLLPPDSLETTMINAKKQQFQCKYGVDAQSQCWRLACRTIVGAYNVPNGTLHVRLRPQQVKPS
eukprot:CAMPEP_0174969084 /NCGR_PEP_ID=MMETSP0004_2-20121128/8530_1 /TAXON_ID=420556 /ORGANISM="Ochromonas sp., Strain CCMP1393" /LENGTH=306 /DNA_ID=CAMNT_0016218463 /DNA_START=148 /DNA_END=1069 /DNA_ORIENTATION=+